MASSPSTSPRRGSQPGWRPSYMSCASLARELDMSESTVREMVERGILPRPIKLGRSQASPVRWNWSDVQRALEGVADAGAVSTDDPYMVGAVHATSARKG